MKRAKIPLFILELPLHTNPVQESTILVRLDTGRQLYNACLGETLNRLDLIRQSKAFKGRSSNILRKEYPELYFISTAGNVSSETIQKYIEAQNRQ